MCATSNGATAVGKSQGEVRPFASHSPSLSISKMGLLRAKGAGVMVDPLVYSPLPVM